MKQYELYFKNTLIGSVIETNWDMSSSGDIRYHFNHLDPSDRLAAFIRHTMRYSHWLESQNEEELEEICSIEEEHFMDFVESEDWYLKQVNGEKIWILAPIFHEKNEITWRLQ